MIQHYDRLNRIRLVALLALPVVLIVLPADFFDSGQSICLSTVLLDMECPGCGMTRSIMHLIHLDVAEAVYHNPLGLVVLPLLGWLWLRAVVSSL